MELEFFKPKNEILQKYIEGYYFLTKKETEPIVEYLKFSNSYSILYCLFIKIQKINRLTSNLN
jgi:hypothetical protein